uniref:C2 domain-containing protein n=1 Tax=Globisporangium ultimum (strain ATCC 200006 / CBS 805.95 / DAOM BR144) TaxID=431595 RepID=K3WYB1_GLOUD
MAVIEYDSVVQAISNNTIGASNVNKLPVEQLLINHARFAYAFKKNDAARLMPFLSKDVTLLTMDGVLHEGLSAVLAYLVGPRMAKLSSHMHIKGSPTCSGASQTKFVYEHGILFRQPLYTEVIEWRENHVIAAIAHVLVPDSKSSKAASQHESVVVKVATPSTPGSSNANQLRVSFVEALHNNQVESDYDGEPEASDEEPERHSMLDDALLLGRSKSLPETSTMNVDRLSLSSNTSSRLSTGSSSGEISGSHDTTLRIQQVVCHDLVPIRHRKRVNPFITIRKCAHSNVWKSSVARKQNNPTWNNVPIEINGHHMDDIMEISLWDFTLFKSVKVATAALVLADLLTRPDDEPFSLTIQLERMDLTDTQPPIQVTMRFAHKGTNPRWSMTTRSSQMLDDLDSDYDAADEASSNDSNDSNAVDASMCSFGFLCNLRWSLQDAILGDSYSTATSMFLRAAFVALLVYIISQVDFESYSRLTKAN